MSVRKGTKISAEEAKTLDRNAMAIALTGDPEVEGQYVGSGRVECPWCGNIGRAPEPDPDRPYRWLLCGACGRAFRE